MGWWLAVGHLACISFKCCGSIWTSYWSRIRRMCFGTWSQPVSSALWFAIAWVRRRINAPRISSNGACNSLRILWFSILVIIVRRLYRLWLPLYSGNTFLYRRWACFVDFGESSSLPRPSFPFFMNRLSNVSQDQKFPTETKTTHIRRILRTRRSRNDQSIGGTQTILQQPGEQAMANDDKTERSTSVPMKPGFHRLMSNEFDFFFNSQICAIHRRLTSFTRWRDIRLWDKSHQGWYWLRHCHGWWQRSRIIDNEAIQIVSPRPTMAPIYTPIHTFAIFNILGIWNMEM